MYIPRMNKDVDFGFNIAFQEDRGIFSLALISREDIITVMPRLYLHQKILILVLIISSFDR